MFQVPDLSVPWGKISCAPTKKALLKVLSRHSVLLFIYSLLIILISIKNSSPQNCTQLEISLPAPCNCLDKVSDSIIHVPQVKLVCLSSWDFSVFHFPSSTISFTFWHLFSILLKVLTEVQHLFVCIIYREYLRSLWFSSGILWDTYR